jgi:hypothetical protein
MQRYTLADSGLGDASRSYAHQQCMILKRLAVQMLPPPVFNQRKRDAPETAPVLPVDAQTPKQRANVYSLPVFRFLAFNGVGKKPCCKPEPIDLHRSHSW